LGAITSVFPVIQYFALVASKKKIILIVKVEHLDSTQKRKKEIIKFLHMQKQVEKIS
jgi:hypothetical protein